MFRRKDCPLDECGAGRDDVHAETGRAATRPKACTHIITEMLQLKPSRKTFA
jgi:hypothetical protein